MRLLVALVLLHGVVTRGPTQPVCQVGKPCTAPAPNVILVFSRAGVVLAHTRTDAKGRYAVRLRPGTYDVRLSTRPRIGTGLAPRRITVRNAPSVRVNFAIDTGIR